MFQAIFRWVHVIAGITWIGLLYFFNWVNSAFAPTMDGDTKKKVIPQLMPRALYWFRWGAAWTWFTGVFLILLVFYHGGLVLDDPTADMGTAAWVLLAITFLGFLVYDLLWNSPLKENKPVAIGVSYLLVAGFVVAMKYWGGFGYRAILIHTGAAFGTAMAFNVWFRIWPAQQKIITAIKNGQAPDAAAGALAGLRSKHNTYLSVPLVWAMINVHTTSFAFGGPGGIIGWLVIILVGWHVVFQIYKKAAKVPGF